MAVARNIDKRKKANDTEEPDWDAMPRYSIHALIEKLEDLYNSGERYVGHLDVMVILAGMILDREIEDTTSSSNFYRENR